MRATPEQLQRAVDFMKHELSRQNCDVWGNKTDARDADDVTVEFPANVHAVAAILMSMDEDESETGFNATNHVLRTQVERQGEMLTAYRELVSAIWLYVDWKYITRQLTTEQRELWAGAIEANSDEPMRVNRWWNE